MVICAHLHMRSETDQALDMVLHMCSCSWIRHNTCLFTCSAMAFDENHKLLLPTSRTSSQHECSIVRQPPGVFRSLFGRMTDGYRHFQCSVESFQDFASHREAPGQGAHSAGR